MLPKRFKSSSNSSSALQIDHSFVNFEARKYFMDFMTKNKPIICEIQFQPDQFEGDILVMLRQRRWETLVVLGGDANVSIIREFYANLRASNSDSTVEVRNKIIHFSAEIINAKPGFDNLYQDDYHTMMEEGPDYEMIIQEMGHRGSQWVYSIVNRAKPLHLILSCLNCYAQAWCKFIRGNLMPTSQNSKLIKEQVVLLYCILTGRSINVGRIIHNNISSYRKGSTTAGHIHLILITHVCAVENVPMSSTDEHWIQPNLYVSSNISRIPKCSYSSTELNHYT